MRTRIRILVMACVVGGTMALCPSVLTVSTHHAASDFRTSPAYIAQTDASAKAATLPASVGVESVEEIPSPVAGGGVMVRLDDRFKTVYTGQADSTGVAKGHCVDAVEVQP